MIYPTIKSYLESLDFESIDGVRLSVLAELTNYIQKKRINGEIPVLQFICTHNSRRSQFTQIWAHTLAYHFDLGLEVHSGGTEVTALNENVIHSLETIGFKVKREGKENPLYRISFSDQAKPIKGYSKQYFAEENPKSSFAAIMTCSDADQNCPYIPGAEARIPLKYDDPKLFDGTPLQSEKYNERCMQIATELAFVLKAIK